MARKPLWISVTGLFGTGKTTLVNDLKDYFVEKGLEVKRFEMPFQRDDVLNKLNNSYDIHADILLLAYYTRLITQEIQELQGSCYDIVLTDGSILDVILYASINSYMFSDAASIQGINTMLIEDLIIFLDAEFDIAYTRIHKKENFSEKFKSKKSLRRQSIQLKKLYDFVQKEKGLKQYQKTKFTLMDTTSNAKQYTLKMAKDFISSCHK